MARYDFQCNSFGFHAEEYSEFSGCLKVGVKWKLAKKKADKVIIVVSKENPACPVMQTILSIQWRKQYNLKSALSEVNDTLLKQINISWFLLGAHFNFF